VKFANAAAAALSHAQGHPYDHNSKRATKWHFDGCRERDAVKSKAEVDMIALQMTERQSLADLKVLEGKIEELESEHAAYAR
jgi:hypothetical protein